MSTLGEGLRKAAVRFLLAASGEGKEYLAEQDRQRTIRGWEETQGLGVEFFNGAPLEPGPIRSKRSRN